RNRAFVGGAAATCLALLLGVIGTGIALADARRENERARNAEREQRVELARTSAHAAHLAAQRGQWQLALENYTKALELGHEDEIALRLGRLDCYLALLQIPTLLAELEALMARDDLGPHEGPVHLWQAEALLYVPNQQGLDPLDQVRLALAKGLP